MESEKRLCQKLTALIFSGQRQISIMSTSILHKLISLKLSFLTCKDRAQVRRFSDKKEWNRHCSLLKRNSGRVVGNIQRSTPRSEVKPPDHRGPGNQGWRNETAFQEPHGMFPSYPASAAQPACRGMATSHGPAVHEQDLPWGAFAFLSSLLLEVGWGPLTLWSRSSFAGSGGRWWIG